MNKINNIKKYPISSNDLKMDIDNFKNKFLNKSGYFTCEKDMIGILMSKSVDIFKNFILTNFKKFKNNFIIRVYKLLKLKSKATSKLLLKFELLEKKLDNQQIILQRSFDLNSKLQKEIDLINNKFINRTTNESVDLNQINPTSIGHNSDTLNTKVDFYQEENLRLGSELVETKKKFEILKKEIEKYEDQRSNLISKINSVNEAINDTNVLTNVFENNIKDKINIKDHNLIESKEENKVNLNQKIKSIFSN
tara:strand:- start:1802 stop:2554 length:753 start_codon:yes stop_codon:yes gene_type:complete